MRVQAVAARGHVMSNTILRYNYLPKNTPRPGPFSDQIVSQSSSIESANRAVKQTKETRNVAVHEADLAAVGKHAD